MILMQPRDGVPCHAATTRSLTNWKRPGRRRSVQQQSTKEPEDKKLAALVGDLISREARCLTNLGTPISFAALWAARGYTQPSRL